MISFRDQNAAYTYEVGSSPDSTFTAADNSDADLGEFFSRPIKLVDFAWSTSIPDFYQNFNPWSLFFENPRVINRITNFNNLRCKLHVRFLINGNGFHFGRLIANYKPLHNSDDFLVDRALSRLDNVAASQRPHVFLDPTNSQGGDMILPFFWKDNNLSIPEQEWREMGEISIRTLQDLKHANGAADVARISVFAWAEEVTLSIPTSSEPGGLTPQGGEDDEYGKGPISRPASVVARVMGKLTNVPYIGAYARATEIAAAAVSSVATVFGYSRPNNLSDVQPYRPAVMGNMSNVNIPDSAVKLAVDCKQELTVDPTTVGLDPVDEMTICSIAERESWLTSFTWSPDSAVHPPESALFSTEVTPIVWNNQTFGGVAENHMPACCFVALPFQNWRGSMKYRFQIVASNYHKGRLKVVYDPHGFQTNEYNTNYTQIIDIAEEKDFTVTIGWGTHKPYLNTSRPGPGAWSNLRFINGSSSVVPGNRANGVLSVYVVNDLTIPSTAAATENIQINVFVSAGPDMMLRNPTAELDRFQWFPEPQSGEEILEPQSGTEDVIQMDADNTKDPSIPIKQESDFMMMNQLSDTDPTDHVFFGESIVSIRSLLKRYNKHSSTVLTGTAGLRQITNYFCSFPFHGGYALNARTPVSGNTQDYNFAHTTLLNWFAPAYKGFRGGLRWKINPTSSSDVRLVHSSYSLNRESGLTSADRVDSQPLSGGGSDMERALFLSTAPMLGGGHATNSSVNPCLEVEVPYQEFVRFGNARHNDFTSLQTLDHPVNLRYQAIINTNTTDVFILDKYVSVGEDFSLFFFIGCPIMYSDVPVPSI